MFKRLKGIKDLLWALGIGAAVLALFVGLIASAVTPYHGERERPTMDLRSGRDETEKAASTEAPSISGLKPDGTLHPLAKTADAGQDYLDGLTFLCDSSFVGLRGAGLGNMPVWSSETGVLRMDDTAGWSIRYPGDGSYISPSSAMMIAKPKILIIAVGSDGLNGLSKESFIENYEALIRSLAKVSPDTRIACLSLCSVTAAYIGTDGLDKTKAEEVNGWIKTVCIDTGAYYGDLTETLCLDSALRSDYADGSGRSLNTAGLQAVLSYLREHSLDGQ